MFQTIKASELGCALDCVDLHTGLAADGSTATDDGPLISAWLAGSTPASPRKLILDGFAMVGHVGSPVGIVGPSGCSWAIEGIGVDACGIGLWPGFGAEVPDVICNGVTNPSDPGTATSTPPNRAGTVSISDLTIVQSRGARYPFYDTTGKGGFAACAINLVNLDTAIIRNVTVLDPQSFHIRISNSRRVLVTDSYLSSPQLASNTDGIHVNGPFDSVFVDNCFIHSGDDAIALNLPEGWGGDAGDVVVSNCIIPYAISLVRAYTTSPAGAHKLNSLTVTNCSGTVGRTVIAPGEYTGSQVDSIGSISVSNCSFQTPNWAAIAANVGTLDFNHCTWISPTVDNGFVQAYTAACTISSLSITDCKVYRNAAGNSATNLVSLNALGGSSIICRIGKLVVNGYTIDGTDGAAYTATDLAFRVGPGSIGTILIDGLDASGFSGFADSFTSISTIGGAGLKATTFPLPDAKVANGYDYISAASNLPSIKLGGTVKTYSLT